MKTEENKETKQRVKVCVWIRPMLSRETHSERAWITVDDKVSLQWISDYKCCQWK